EFSLHRRHRKTCLCIPVQVSQQWLVRVEPLGRLEICHSTRFSHGPFTVVHVEVMGRTQSDGVIFIGLSTLRPFLNVVALAVGGLHNTTRCLATFITREDRFSLRCGEEPFTTVFVEDDILPVPYLPD